MALLLAIFRSRPSPFCVLDEVDAALDEANIDRFTQVLKDFLAWTQFIIVTHSKKTMTAADTIYGVTMQESGVTKQVSVRFEDVSDDGEILSQPRGRRRANAGRVDATKPLVVQFSVVSFQLSVFNGEELRPRLFGVSPCATWPARGAC